MTEVTPLKNTTSNPASSSFVITEKERRLHRYFYVLLFVCGLGVIFFLLFINGQSIYERGI